MATTYNPQVLPSDSFTPQGVPSTSGFNISVFDTGVFDQNPLQYPYTPTALPADSFSNNPIPSN